MVYSALILGIIGEIIFIIIIMTVKKLLRSNESGFLHLLMCIMYICWLPIPIVVNLKIGINNFLIIGTIFGTLSLILLSLTMLIQSSHLSYSAVKSNCDLELWNSRDEWVLNGLIGGQVELFALFLKSIWYIFFTIYFLINSQFIFFMLGVLFSLLSIFYLSMLIERSVIKKVKYATKLKLNSLIINIETATWFFIILIWLCII